MPSAKDSLSLWQSLENCNKLFFIFNILVRDYSKKTGYKCQPHQTLYVSKQELDHSVSW